MRVRKLGVGISFLAVALLAQAEPIFPTGIGASWEYEVAGAGARGDKPKVTTMRIAGSEDVRGQSVLKLETKSNGELIKTELISVNERGLLCHARIWSDEKAARFDPPQTLVPAALKVGVKWELDDTVAGSDMRQKWNVEAEEEIEVPAGRFKTYRLRSEQPWPVSLTIERWFAPGTGFVKDITTTRGPTGRLLSRVTTTLTKFAVETAVEPASSPAPSPPASTPDPGPTPVATPAGPLRIKLEVSAAREGEAIAEFRSDAPNIFVRWAGENLPVNSGVRIAWIAEDVGDVAPANFVVDQTETLVTTANFGARFTLSRPEDGWAAGKYRVELYLEEDLIETVKVTISD